MAKNKAAETKVDDNFEPEITGELHDEQLGFPAYWAPAEEPNSKGHFGSFKAKLIGFDDSDPEFERWVFQATHRTLCHKGPTDDQEEVIIEPGGYFSVSNYAQLNLAQYMDLTFLLIVMEKIDLPKGKTMWKWECKTDNENHARLVQRRQNIVSNAMARPAKEAATS